MDKKIKSLLSLCQKAGKLVSGEVGCEKALANKTAKLVIVSENASENTKKKFSNKAFYYKVNCVEYGSKEEISNAIGKSNRATVVITDINFADKLFNLIEQEKNV